MKSEEHDLREETDLESTEEEEKTTMSENQGKMNNRSNFIGCTRNQEKMNNQVEESSTFFSLWIISFSGRPN